MGLDISRLLCKNSVDDGNVDETSISVSSSELAAQKLLAYFDGYTNDCLPVDSYSQTELNSNKSNSLENKKNKYLITSQKSMMLKKMEKNKKEGEELAKKLIELLSTEDSSFGEILLEKVNSQNLIPLLDVFVDLNNSNTLIETICEISDNSIKEKLLVLIKDKLKQRSSELGIKVKALELSFSHIQEKIIDNDSKDLDSDIKKLVKICNSYSKKIKNKEQKLLDKASTVTLEEQLKARYKEENFESKFLRFCVEGFDKLRRLSPSAPDVDFLGDGSLDNNARQMAGNCWLLGMFFSMCATPEGSEIVDSLSVPNGANIISIIPEARCNGLKNGGLFEATVGERIKGTFKHSIGEGDITAYSLAVKKYFTEIGENDGDINGNTIYRGFEIISGDKVERYKDANIPMGVGISINILSKGLYNNMQTLHNNGKAAFQIEFNVFCNKLKDATLVDHNYKPVEGKPFISEKHAYAIVKIEKDFIYLQESNHPDSYIKLTQKEFLLCCDRLGSLRWD